MFFDGWYPLLRVLVVGACAYAALVLFLRIAGKRTLSKLNAFDLVITVSLGSTLATVLLSREVSLSEGVLAFALLVTMQYLVTWTTLRSRIFDRLVKSEPTLLYYDGTFIHDAMRRERVVEGEILAAVREQGIPSLGDVEAVVLETASTISVIRKSDASSTALRDLRNLPENPR